MSGISKRGFFVLVGTVVGAFALILAASVFLGCGANQPASTLGPSVDASQNSIKIWTHNLSPKMHDAVKYTAKILREDVFDNKGTCPSIVVNKENTNTMRSGINVYNDRVAPGSHFNGCRAPYAAMTRNSDKAIVNLCSIRINPAVWTHALDPDIYLTTNLISRSMGLPPTVSNPNGSASYTANDRNVMTARNLWGDGRPGIFFRFSEGEKKALRARYCR